MKKMGSAKKKIMGIFYDDLLMNCVLHIQILLDVESRLTFYLTAPLVRIAETLCLTTMELFSLACVSLRLLLLVRLLELVELHL